MKTLILLEVEHSKPIPYLASMIAGRAYTIDGVKNAEPFQSPFKGSELRTRELQEQGFTLAEIALGAQEVHRA